MPADSPERFEHDAAPAVAWWRRLWLRLHSRFARQIALTAVVVGALAATGHFIGGMVGWWHAYEITFGNHEAAKPAPASTRAKVAALPLSIVVLPFTNAGAVEDDWFVENLTNDIAVELSRVPGSSVIGREAAVRYRGKEADPREVARELEVRYVLAGSAERVGDKVRLRVKLLDGETGAQRWAERFDFERATLPGLVDGMSARLARVVDLEMVRAAGSAAARLAPEAARADDLAMQGWAVLYRGLNPTTNREALALFERAVTMDVRSVRGWGGVAYASGNERRWGRAEAALRRLGEAADQLDRLDPGGYYTLLARSLVPFYTGGDPEAALAAADRLVELYPGHHAGYQMRGVVLVRMGRFDEALVATDKALALLPHNPDTANRWRHSFIFYALGRYAESAAEARQVVATNPSGVIPIFTLAAALARDGKPEQARQVLDEARRHHPDLSTAKVAELLLQGSGERFIAAREDMLAALREVGLP
jgi:TolB-like protein